MSNLDVAELREFYRHAVTGESGRVPTITTSRDARVTQVAVDADHAIYIEARQDGSFDVTILWRS